ncbi:MAG: CRISPR-associated endoribonuclease Cas6 [Bacilli bacterium]|jgi:CRISPR-associated endoribonuclease Cas6
MRVRIYLELDDKKISVKYHSLLQGLIYHSLGYTNEVTELHNDGNKIENRPFKLFTFSEIYAKASYLQTEKKLHFLENGYFDFTSFNQELVIKFIDHINLNNKIVLGQIIINVIGYDLLDDNVILNDNPITFTTCSPIVCYKTDNKKIEYLNPLDYEFVTHLKNNIAKKFYLCYEEDLPLFEIINIENIKKKVIYFRETFYVAYHCKITVQLNDKRLANMIMTTGLGAKNSMGFGMVNYEKKILSL